MIEIEIGVSKKKKEILIPISYTYMLPQYLKYLLEYKQIPNTYKIQFLDKVFENIQDFIDKEGKNGN